MESNTPTQEKSESTPTSPQPTTSTAAIEPVLEPLLTAAGKPRKRVGELSYTPEIGAAVIASVAGGMPVKMASQYHRVPYRTVMHWLSEGEKGKDPFEAFAVEVRQAQATFVFEMIEAIKEAGVGNAKQWTALMTLLERLYPEDFRRPTERTENLHLHGFVDGRIHELLGAGEVGYTGA